MVIKTINKKYPQAIRAHTRINFRSSVVLGVGTGPEPESEFSESKSKVGRKPIMETDTTNILLAVAAGALILYVTKQLWAIRKLPPGPWGLPVVGLLIHLNKANILTEFEKYRQKYGDIFSLRLGSFNVVAIHGYKQIREAFKSDNFLGRPDFDGWKVRNFGEKNRGILFSDGVHSWNEQRRFTLKQLRDFGFGKESMEGLVVNELEFLVKHLKKTGLNKPLDMKTVFNASVLNSLWLILSGRRFELDDKAFLSTISLLTSNVKASTVASPNFFFTWPIKYGLIPGGTALRARFLKQRDDIIAMLEKDVKQHSETFQDNQERDFIDMYLAQIKVSEPGSSFHGEEGQKNLLIVLQDLFVAGAETTSTTLLWSVLQLATNQRVQQRLFAEIEAKIGLKRHPSRDDKSQMVYTEAFLNEIHRHTSLVPFCVYHKVFEDTVFEGHFIPKNTVIFANLYEAHHNKDYWKDPMNFRPERFLDETETKLVKPDALIPFSVGKRICLGEALARDTLFLFLIGLMQQFSFELAPGSSYDPTVVPEQATFIMSPNPFEVILRPRQK